MVASEGVGETLRTRRIAMRVAVRAASATRVASITSLAPLSQGRRFAVRLTATPASSLDTHYQLTERYLDDTQRPPP